MSVSHYSRQKDKAEEYKLAKLWEACTKIRGKCGLSLNHGGGGSLRIKTKPNIKLDNSKGGLKKKVPFRRLDLKQTEKE